MAADSEPGRYGLSKSNGSSSLVLIATALLGLASCSHNPDLSYQFPLRMLNAGASYGALDTYVDEPGKRERRIHASVPEGQVSDYAAVEVGTYKLSFRRSSAAANLLSLSDSASSKDRPTTYVVYSAGGALSALKIDEGRSEPDPGKTLVQVLNAAEAGSVSVYLTGPDESLVDLTPQFRSIEAGVPTGFLELDSDAYRLRVTGEGNTGDLRLDAPDVTLDDGGVLSVILTPTPGGVLLDSVVLPQQEQPRLLGNVMTRIRAANAVSLGRSMFMQIAGITMFSSATPGILSQYVQVQAGAVPLVLSIDGLPIAVPDQTLLPGHDYTLLAWDDAETLRLTLLNDDNRLPAITGAAKVRLVNAVSGTSEAINLSIDHFPIASGIRLGQSSAYVEVTAGSEARLEVLSSVTAATLWQREEAVLEAGRVYTLLMAAQAGGEVTGSLRLDR